MFDIIKKAWDAPAIKGTIGLRGLVGATAITTVVFTVILTICTLLAANASSFGTTWGPIIGAAATLITSIITAFNLGTPVPPAPPIPSTEVHVLEWKAIPKEQYKSYLEQHS